jgi:ketosteroid isomerase-like protein
MSSPQSDRLSDEQIVRKAYEAFARGDIDEAVADLHPEVEWTEPEPFPMAGRYRGRVAVREYLSASRASWRELRTNVNLHSVNGKVIAVHHLVGVLRDGAPAEATVADVFTLRGGTVVDMQAYANPSDAFAAEDA